jgi:enoyl-CoA hydratase/carnithine racemase
MSPVSIGADFKAVRTRVIAGSSDFDAATAERYGWINRAIPDAEFETWVDGFARRLASFDKQALGHL